MAKISTQIHCKCGFPIKIIASRPNPTSRATGRTTCSQCMSQLLYELTAGKDEGSCNIKSGYLAISPDLQAMLDEEAKEQKEVQVLNP